MKSKRRLLPLGAEVEGEKVAQPEELPVRWLTGFIEEKPLYISRTHAAEQARNRGLKNAPLSLEFHRIHPPPPPSARVVRGTKPPEIAGVVLRRAGAILYQPGSLRGGEKPPCRAHCSFPLGSCATFQPEPPSPSFSRLRAPAIVLRLDRPPTSGCPRRCLVTDSDRVRCRHAILRSTDRSRLLVRGIRYAV